MKTTLGWMIAAAVLTGCRDTDSKAEPSASKREEKAPAEQPRAAPESSAEEAVAPPDPWKRVEPEALSETERAHLDSAKAAKKALASNLMKELGQAIEGGNFARGVEACQDAAPRVADQVSSEHGVEVGRTSFKVRNPKNAPRPWAEPFVEARVAEDIVLTRPDGAMAYMSPIRMKEICLNCHGSAAQIPSEVSKMLSKSYPEDQATGFDVNDLRGWFWVEYAAGS